MQIIQKTANSLPATLATFEVGETATFSYADFALNDAQSYRSSIWRWKKLGVLPEYMKFHAINLEVDGRKVVLITRVK